MKSERKYSDGLTALGAGLTVVALGATILTPPGWAAYVYFAVGIIAAIIGTKWLRESSKEAKRGK